MTGWLPTDCHAHTTFSDGDLSVHEVVGRAAALGVRPSVTDHISRDAPTTLDTAAAVASYLDELERHPVLRGGEFCWHDGLWRELSPAVVRRFTHRVGSLHAVRLPDRSFYRAFNRTPPPSLDAAGYLEAHVSSLESLAAEMPVDVLAHPTLVPLSLREIDPEELWSEALEERAVNALVASGIAFEISHRYAPHERLVRRAVQRGVRISLGSDGHSRGQVANIVAPLAMARRLGVADDDLYDPARHGSRTGAWP